MQKAVETSQISGSELNWPRMAPTGNCWLCTTTVNAAGNRTISWITWPGTTWQLPAPLAAPNGFGPNRLIVTAGFSGFLYSPSWMCPATTGLAMFAQVVELQSWFVAVLALMFDVPEPSGSPATLLAV